MSVSVWSASPSTLHRQSRRKAFRRERKKGPDPLQRSGTGGVPRWTRAPTSLLPADPRPSSLHVGTKTPRRYPEPMVVDAPKVTLIRRKRLHTRCFHQALTSDPDPSLLLTLVEIKAGHFAMGSPTDERYRDADEGPQQSLKLGNYMMGQTPITQAQWRAVAEWEAGEGEKWGRWARELNPNPSRFQGQREALLLEGEETTDQRPVERVSWYDAMEFCDRLSQRTKLRYTLPSEAQWEYACRAGTTTPFHFGETLSPELANYNGNFTYANGPKGVYRRQTTPVAQFPANGWGLHDMHGNVLEWCLDHWHANLEGAPENGSAWIDDVESEVNQRKRRLLRGGSWNFNPVSCRSAVRNHGVPDGVSNGVGFRVVCLPQGRSS